MSMDLYSTNPSIYTLSVGLVVEVQSMIYTNRRINVISSLSPFSRICFICYNNFENKTFVWNVIWKQQKLYKICTLGCSDFFLFWAWMWRFSIKTLLQGVAKLWSRIAWKINDSENKTSFKMTFSYLIIIDFFFNFRTLLYNSYCHSWKCQTV